MSPIVDPAVEAYVAAHSTPHAPHLEALERETHELTAAPQMLSGAVEGRLLELLVWLSRARRVLEFGTFTGYSALTMAAMLPPDGRLITLESSDEHADIAQRHVNASGYADRIEIRRGPALRALDDLRDDEPFDLVFIDADKPGYMGYYEASLPLLAERGVVAIDNTLWHGSVADTEDQSENAVALRALNDHIRADERVVAVLLTVRDGITLVRRR